MAVGTRWPGLEATPVHEVAPSVSGEVAETQELTKLSRSELKAQAASLQQELAARPRIGRPPAHPRLTLKDEGTLDTLTERALGLSTTDIVLHELDCSEQELVQFMRRAKVKATLQKRVMEYRQSGEHARKIANVGLSVGVERMRSIVSDPEVGANTAVNATGMLSKIASTNGRAKEQQDPGSRFSIVINLGGEIDPLRVETEIEGEVFDG